MWAESRSPSVAGLQGIQAPCQLGGQHRLVYAELFRDASEVSAAGIQQLHQVMFDLNIVMSAGKAEPRGRFQHVPSGVVQLPNQ